MTSVGSKVFPALGFSLLLLDYSAVVCADLPAPQNVTLHTLNTYFVLKWDWDPDQGSDGARNVTFTAQYLAKFKIKKPEQDQNWISVCVLTGERRCDFSSAKLHYRGMWLLRVRTQYNHDVSSWVQIEFCPDKEAILGPPSAVNLTPINGLLQVMISDPLSSNNASMREWLPGMYYRIIYWKTDLQAKYIQKHNELTATNNLVILPDLENWTWYCVKVQTHEDFYNKTSVFSPTYCMQTNGQIPYWQIVQYILLSLVMLVFSACLLWFFKMVKSVFYPLVPLPTHIHEHLYDFAGSDTPQLLSMEPDVENCCEIVLTLYPTAAEVNKVIPEVYVRHNTLEQSSRTQCHHSSGDSGVYSTEEDSGLRQSEQGEVIRDKTRGKIEWSWTQECGT